MTIKQKAYAKINFTLAVLGERPDGYHEIRSVMQALELCDTVKLSCVPSDDFSVELDPGKPYLPNDERNLAYKAAVLMHETFHCDEKEKISISVEKNIPVAAGLAGGSADGAAVITALAKLWGLLPLDAPVDLESENFEKLSRLAAALGSDLPFCLMAQNGSPAAIATGTGTTLTSIQPTAANIFLAKPCFSVSTKEIYGELKPEDCLSQIDDKAFISSLPLNEKLSCMGNHLQAACFRLYPKTEEVYRELKNKNPLAVQMSGSGPTIFAVYKPSIKLKHPALNVDQRLFCTATRTLTYK